MKTLRNPKSSSKGFGWYTSLFYIYRPFILDISLSWNNTTHVMLTCTGAENSARLVSHEHMSFSLCIVEGLQPRFGGSRPYLRNLIEHRRCKQCGYWVQWFIFLPRSKNPRPWRRLSKLRIHIQHLPKERHFVFSDLKRP